MLWRVAGDNRDIHCGGGSLPGRAHGGFESWKQLRVLHTRTQATAQNQGDNRRTRPEFSAANVLTSGPLGRSPWVLVVSKSRGVRRQAQSQDHLTEIAMQGAYRGSSCVVERGVRQTDQPLRRNDPLDPPAHRPENPTLPVSFHTARGRSSRARHPISRSELDHSRVLVFNAD